MKRVLLINVAEGSGTGTRYIPLGIAYIAAELRASGRYQVECLDYQLPEVDDKTVLRRLREASYAMVGMRGFGGDYLKVKELAANIRQALPAVMIVVGGPLATFSYEVVLEETDADYCIIGEGETSVVELLDSEGREPALEGVAYKDSDGGIVCHDNRKIPAKSIDDISIPAYDLFQVKQYLVRDLPVPSLLKRKKVRMIDILTGRGCPYSCKFCGKIVKKYRKRKVDDIIAEIQHLKKTYDVNHLSINDELFINYNRQWLEDFCARVKPLQVTWHCATRAHGLSLDELKMMKAAGCVRVNMGVESCSHRNLIVANKKITPDDIHESICLLRKAGIYPGTSLIIGFPGESKETVDETIEFYRDHLLPPKKIAFLQPYPGSAYFREYLESGKIASHRDILEKLSGKADGADTAGSPQAVHNLKQELVFNFTDMTDEELIGLKQYAEKKMKENYEAQMKRNNFIEYALNLGKQNFPFKTAIKRLLAQ